jgi:hypothetical protein
VPDPWNPQDDLADHAVRWNLRISYGVAVSLCHEIDDVVLHLLFDSSVDDQFITIQIVKDDDVTVRVGRSVNVRSVYALNDDQVSYVKRSSKRMGPSVTRGARWHVHASRGNS